MSDGKEAVVKAANLLFMKYWNLSKSGKIDKEGVFTEANLAEALQAVGLYYSPNLFSDIYIITFGIVSNHISDFTCDYGCIFSGGGGPEPDLLLVYGPARCHLGFPAWRIRYTEIV